VSNLAEQIKDGTVNNIEIQTKERLNYKENWENRKQKQKGFYLRQRVGGCSMEQQENPAIFCGAEFMFGPMRRLSAHFNWTWAL